MSRNTKDLHPKLQAKITELTSLCEKNGLKIGISECFRTVEEQNALYAKGRTAMGSIVTNAAGTSYSSQHQWGIAADFYRNDGKGAYDESGNFFDQVGALAKSIGLGWGGDWTKPKDKPHLYLPDWGKTTASLKSQYKTPECFIRTWNTGDAAVFPEPVSKDSYSRELFIRELQAAIGAKADGIAGKETLSKTVTLSKRINQKHAAVKPVQKYLNLLGYDCGTADGIAGAKFHNAVTAYQKAHGCIADGIITKQNNTWKSLLGLK